MPSLRDSPAKSPPTSAARIAGLAYRSRTLVAASNQPSLASRRYLDRIARLVGTPSSQVSIQPSGSATCDEPRRWSAVVTSRSGLGPGESLRKTLSIDSSPKTRLVLDG